MNSNLFDQANAAEDPGWFTAHCDGGSRGNPGPAGYGAVIQDSEGRTVARLSKYLGRQTNNFAEYSGLLAVLDWAIGNGVKRLRVVSDSELMVNQMKGRYKVASPGLRPLWEQAQQRAARFERFEMRHTLRGGNKDADRLANEAMDQGQGKPPANQPVSKSSEQRQVLEGYVKNGVVHLLEGELPDGIFVKITRS